MNTTREQRDEEWRNIPGIMHYQVSNMGMVRSIDRLVSISGKSKHTRISKGKVLSLNNNPGGYSVFCGKGKGRLTYVHSAVCAAFFGEKPDGMVVDHINGDKKDNRVENLRYTSRSINVLNKKATGCSKYRDGRWHARIKVDKNDLYLGGFTNKEEAISAYQKYKTEALCKA